MEQHPKFKKHITYKVKRKHPDTKEKLSENWIIPDKVLEKYKKYKNFHLINIRGGLSTWLINVCIKGKVLKPPIPYRKDIEKKGGLNKTTKQRKNIYYENISEKNPENYKFCISTNEDTISTDTVRNTSMFNY